jgi:phage portal protein BeeE
MDVVRKAFVGITGGAEKFNKVEVVEQAVDFTQLGMSANDLKLIESQLPHIRSVCRALNLPSQLFGDFQSSQYANYKEANKAFYTNAVIPQLDTFINQFEKDLFTPINRITGNNYWLRVAKEDIDALARTKADVLKDIPNNISAMLLSDITPEQKAALRTDLGLDEQG